MTIMNLMIIAFFMAIFQVIILKIWKRFSKPKPGKWYPVHSLTSLKFKINEDGTYEFMNDTIMDKDKDEKFKRRQNESI